MAVSQDVSLLLSFYRWNDATRRDWHLKTGFKLNASNSHSPFHWWLSRSSAAFCYHHPGEDQTEARGGKATFVEVGCQRRQAEIYVDPIRGRFYKLLFKTLSALFQVSELLSDRRREMHFPYKTHLLIGFVWECHKSVAEWSPGRCPDLRTGLKGSTEVQKCQFLDSQHSQSQINTSNTLKVTSALTCSCVLHWRWVGEQTVMDY